MENLLRALIVEDSQNDTLLLVRVLHRAGYKVEYTRVDNEADMFSALETRSWDLVISDFSMPNFSATAALKLVQEQKLDLPFIIVSGTMGEEAAVAAMKAGAHDYFPKGRTARLAVAINRELREAKERKRHKVVEQELLQAEKRFTQAFQINPSAIYISSLEKDEIWEINPRFLKLFDFSRDEVIGKTSSELSIWLNPEERQQQIKHIQQEGTIYDIAMQAQSKSGYIHHVLVSCELIVLGQDSCIMTFIHDITERKQAEDELRALYNATSVLFKADDLTSLGQQIVRAVIDEFKQFDCGLILVDTKQDRLIRLVRSGEQRIETDAPLYRDGAGLVPEAIRSGEMIYVPDVSLDERYLAHEQQTQSELVLPLKTSKGTLGVLDLQSTHKDAFSEGDRRILSTFAERAALALELMALYEEVHRHATELEARVAQRTFELRQSKERVEAIFNNSFDAIALVDAKGLIQQTNLAFDTLFGYSTDALFQHRLTEISDDAHIKILENAIEKVVHSKQSKRLELQAQREDQTQLIVDLALAAVSHDPIAAVYVICSFRDVTERKRLEENLRQTLEKEQELNQMKSRFTAMVSHEFRSPLAVIQSATDILKNYLDRLSDEKKQQYLDRIHGQIKRLTQMVEDVLIIGEAQTLGIQFAPRLLDLESFCRKIVEEIQATTNQHQLRFVATGDGTDMLIDEKLFQQILTNLLSNAVKYSPKGGDIACELICTEKQVVLHVKDTGIGIPEADLEHLFEDFHRAGNVAGITGTGLGLSIVKRAVDAHKGTIQVKSTLGIGTVFTLRLPI